MSGPRFSPAFREELHQLFAWRRDVRAFRTDPLPEGLLERLIATACLAPSVGLSQPWRFVEVTEPARRAAIRANFEAANAEALAAQDSCRQTAYARLKLAGLDDAPCHLAVFADAATAQGHGLGRRTMPEAIDYSAVLAIHTLWLAARAEGIGVGWVSILDPAGVGRALEVPEGWHFVGYLCIGHPQAEHEVPTLELSGWDHRRPAESFLLRR
ncbi:oxidoreductase [Azorhizobium oxalatiphilum]|uniref:Oxidoreductase n=1 Tax=Azorhizobium oxalatiphilum TaxID=980631 RepID=A0A917CB83_9HYPH|nr:5,6-dimethylbenzimidazole synthase [Azorhizobium oxalatiphilum]GGF79588.1 oxidoreductase [Azorhizobium oxalatiphilum]